MGPSQFSPHSLGVLPISRDCQRPKSPIYFLRTVDNLRAVNFKDFCVQRQQQGSKGTDFSNEFSKAGDVL